MTRFVFLSDTHIGTTPIEFQQQPAFPEQIHHLIDALERWLAQEANIDFVLHGGDMLNDASRANIRTASALFKRLSVPVYLCLGNHDLTDPDALAWWLEEAPQFFPQGQPNFVIDRGSIRICVMPNQWDSSPWYWSDVQNPSFTRDQKQWARQLADEPQGPGIRMLVTHSPVYAITCAQTGFAEPYHTPPPSFSSEIRDLSALWPELQCVAGAHSHINSCIHHDELTYVTVSSFVESPFEFKVFEVHEDYIQMTTHNLDGDVGFRSTYNFDKTYVQGRQCDRQFRVAGRENTAIQHP